MKQVILVTGGVIVALTLIVAGFTSNQVSQEQIDLTSRLQSRTQLLADSLNESIGPAFVSGATTSVQSTVNRFIDKERVTGLAVYDNAGEAFVLSEGMSHTLIPPAFVSDVMDRDESNGIFLNVDGQALYVFAEPIHHEELVVGALVIVQSSQYINDGIGQIWRDNLLRLFLQIVLIAGAIFVLVRWVFLKPLSRLAESMQAIRRGDVGAVEPNGDQSFLMPLSSEISKITTSLRQARLASSEEARMRLEKIDSPWTAERLKEFVKAYLKDRPIYVVSNIEPYRHNKIKNKVDWSIPAGGVVTALGSVMEACGGMWIAHGSGNADKETVDKDGKIAVPPEEPKYTLKRIWLTPKEVQGFYNGFSNEALWPLCHMAHIRPVFREEDWREYRKVNGAFAKALLAEIKNVERPLILVQDFHLALLPALIKKSRPDAQVAIFWHIPWPDAAQFSICPWRKDILEGMLGADLVGFHTQQYCNNFMDTISSEIEARIDLEQFSIIRDDHRTHIRPFPVSIAFPGSMERHAPQNENAFHALNIRTEYVGLGVDRLDYTKGILERFKGVEFFLRDHPEYKERFTFLQIASPTRESVEKYREYAAEVTDEAKRINELLGSRTWQPIILEKKQYSHRELQPLYEQADFCLVSSLHDGMNLVAKEYVAAREDESGVLILSQFTGAARDLKGALLINPYSAENTSETIHQALTMQPTEQHRRMKTMRDSVRNYNVYRWSAELIKTLAGLD